MRDRLFLVSEITKLGHDASCGLDDDAEKEVEKEGEKEAEKEGEKEVEKEVGKEVEKDATGQGLGGKSNLMEAEEDDDRRPSTAAVKKEKSKNGKNGQREGSKRDEGDAATMSSHTAEEDLD